MERTTKQKYLSAAGLLLVATAAVKVIGAVYKIPLTGLIRRHRTGLLLYGLYAVYAGACHHIGRLSRCVIRAGEQVPCYR